MPQLYTIPRKALESLEKPTAEASVASAVILQNYFVLCPLHEVSFQHPDVGEEVLIVKILGLRGAASHAGMALDADAAYRNTVGGDRAHGAHLDAEAAAIAVLDPRLRLRFKEGSRRAVFL